jgi:putative ABC transport system permease protein
MPTRRWLRRWRNRPQEDFAEEIRAHLALEQDELQWRGLKPDEARDAARRAFGNVTAARERYHERGRFASWDYLLKDAAYAARMLRKSKWFTASAIAILALAIGANLTVFALIDGVMLRSIPVSRPDELVRIDPSAPEGRVIGLPSTVLEPLKREAVFGGICGFATPRIGANLNGAITHSNVLAMSGDCWKTLGVQTQLGRPFTAEDDRPEAANVVVLSASLWRSVFGGSSDVLGKQIQAGAESYTVIGVAAERFTGLTPGYRPALIVPLMRMPSDEPGRRYVYHWVSVFARRAPGVSEATVAARIAAIAPALLEQSVPRRFDAGQRRHYLTYRLTVAPARTGVDLILRRRFSGPLTALWGVCAAVLLIACLNLASLLVARAIARQKELSIRLAIGATRWRVIRPLAFESFLLAAAGGLAGAMLASWAGEAIVTQMASMFAQVTLETSWSARGAAALAVVVFAVAAILTAVPVWQAGRVAESGGLRASGRGVVGGGARTQKALIAIQVAFTLALVAAGGVFASSFQLLAGLPLGLRIEDTAQAMLSPVPGGYRLAEPGAYYASLLESVASLPGVRSASLTNFALYWYRLQPEPVRTTDGGAQSRAQTIAVSHGYFRSLGAQLLAGEDFRPESREPEAIVNETAAAELGGGMPGRSIVLGEGASARRYRVIGVAPAMTISMADLRESRAPVVYLNFWQDRRQQRYPVLLVQGASGRPPDRRGIARALEARGVEYVQEYLPLEEARDQSIVEDRLLAYLTNAFGLVALVLAAIGLFAILSCYVSRRTGEFGVRIALGASAADLRRLVVRQIGVVLAVGVAAGLGLAVVAGKAVGAIAYGVAPGDPMLLGSAVGLVLIAALVAAWIPARRAASIHPVEALRRD